MGRKIAIAVQGGHSLEAVMDPRFGRAARFLIVDEGGDILTAVDNVNTMAVQGAGPATASLVERTGATAVISGAYGPKAYQALRSLGIEPWVGEEGRTAAQLLEDFREGRLGKA